MAIVTCPCLCRFVDCNYCHICVHFYTWREILHGGGYKEGGKCMHPKKISYVDEYGFPHEIPEKEWLKESGEYDPRIYDAGTYRYFYRR